MFSQRFYALTIGAIVAATPLAGALVSAPQSGQAAIVFPPGYDHGETARAVARSGLAFVRTGSLSNIAIVDLSGEAASARLREAGALFILDPLILGGCLNGGTDRYREI